MQNVKKMLTSILKFSVSTWVNFVVGVLSALITTRLFSKETYALITIFNTAATTGMTITCMGLDSGYIRFFYEPPASNSSKQLAYKLMGISVLTTLGAGIIFSAFFYADFSLLLFEKISRPLCVALFVNILANVVLRFLNITYRMQLNIRQYTVQNILFQCLSRIIIFCMAFFSADVQSVIFAVTGGMALMALFYLYLQREDIFFGDKNLSLKGYAGVFRFSVFCAPVSIAVNCNTLVTNLIIKEKIGLGQAGIYASAASIALIINVLQGGFSTFWSGYVYANYKKAKELCRQVHDIVMLFCCVCMIGLVVFKDVLFCLLGKSFQEGRHFFSLLLMYPLLSLIMETTAYGISIAKKTYLTLLYYLLFMGVNVFCSFALAGPLGVKGVALSGSLAALVLFFLQTWSGQKYYRTIRSKAKTGFSVIAMEMIAVLDTYREGAACFWLFVLGFLGMVLLLYRKELKTVAQYLRKALAGQAL